MPLALAHGLALAALSALPLQGAGAEPQVIVLLEAGQEEKLLDVVRERPDEVREPSRTFSAQRSVASARLPGTGPANPAGRATRAALRAELV